MNFMKNWPSESSRGARWVVLLVGLAWAGVGLGDWAMRIRWFRWHQGFIFRSSSPFTAPFRPMLLVTNAVSRGGDLTQLIGLPDVAARFQEGRATSISITDEFGFQNAPPVRDRDFPMVVTGDSYMLSGPGNSAAFSAQLEAVSGLPVYNHAYAGRGSFWGLLRLLLSDRFQGRMPGVIVWGLIEREIAGGYFAGVRAQLLYFDRVKSEVPGRTHFNRYELSPRRLRSSLPNSSALGQVAARLWNHLRYRCLREMNPAVLEATGAVGGRPMLFYGPAVDAMRWSEQTRDPAVVTEIIDLLNGMAQKHGSRIVVVLIPDKERLYEDLLPSSVHRWEAPLRPSVLPELERRLRERGIGVVNLLPSFQAARGKGAKLFWNDDTHWHPEGIRIAAEETWGTVSGLIAPRQE